MSVILFTSVLDLYASTPALETLMDVPLTVRKAELLKVTATDIVASYLLYTFLF